MMPEPPVLVVIVNWNLKQETIACLESVRSTRYPCDIVVVDNGSEDDSAEEIAGRFPDVRVLALSRNVGFAAACNLGLKQGLSEGTQYVLLLNNDTIADRELLTELVRAAETHPDAGILGPKVCNASQPDRIWYAGARRRRWVLAAVSLGHDQLDQGQFERTREVDYIFGCGMFIRRQVLEVIGTLDPRFFLYLEDMDLCLRAQAAGFRLLYVPGAKILHWGSASTASNPALRKYHLVRSTWLFLRKHAARIWLPAAVLFWGLVFLRALIVEVLRGDLTGLRAYSKGLLEAWGRT
jgi:GT2 family glycosyltransferase